MAPTPGDRLGPYQIVALLGSGGMGAVYRALDLRLGRTVAVKVLREEAWNDPQARARFEREARAISQLSHPHICPLFDVGQHNGRAFLVMEHLKGETLDRCLRRGPLPLDRVLQHAKEIAGALDAAHRSGIIHRDLKPGNVMLTRTGAKLLDFGLAKLRRSPLGDVPLESTASTHTREGALVGTLPYMAPEQLEGKETDGRGDIFAFGAMVYEMATGRRAFQGSSRAGVVAAILTSEPEPPSRLRPDCPSSLDRLVMTCLAKDPDERWQSAHDILLELGGIAPHEDRRGPTRAFPAIGWRLALAAATAAAVGAALWALWPSPGPDVRSGTPHQVTSEPGWEAEPALSPDGSLIAYASDQSGNADIWLTDAQGGNAVRLTDDPSTDRDPAWFPDGSAVAFVSDRGGRTSIWKVMRLGGPATLLVPDAEDPAISPDGREIAFTRPGDDGQRRITVAPLREPERARALTSADEGLWDHRNPAWSPDGRWVCYQAQRDLWLVSAAGGGARRLTTDDEVDADPVFAADGGSVYFSSFREGAFALWRVGVDGGVPERLSLGTGPERDPSLSRDGRRLAYATLFENPDVVLRDLATGKEQRLEGLRDEVAPALSPDGRLVAFVSDRLQSRYDLWLQPIVGQTFSGSPRRLTDHPGSVSHPAFAPDGRWVAYHRVEAGRRDIWIVDVASGAFARFTDDPATDIHPRWSPDGSQLAFISSRGGAEAIWIAPVANGRPAGPARRLDASSGPNAPTWSPRGDQIAYTGKDGGRREAYVADVQTGAWRRITSDAGAGRVRWDRRGEGLFVSGWWGGATQTLRHVDLRSQRSEPLEPPVVFGQNPDVFYFDTCCNDNLLVYSQEQSRSDIWLLETREPPR